MDQPDAVAGYRAFSVSVSAAILIVENVGVKKPARGGHGGAKWRHSARDGFVVKRLRLSGVAFSRD